MRVLILALLLSLPAVVLADIYRWTDSEGVVHYSDQPMKPEAESVTLPELQYSEPVTSTFEVEPEESKTTQKQSNINIEIVKPKPETTFTEGAGLVTTKVSLSRPLEQQEQLTYRLDGQAKIAETQSTTATFNNVARGAHHVQVVLKKQGKQIAETASVKFFVRRPSILNNPGSNTSAPAAPSYSQVRGSQ